MRFAEIISEPRPTPFWTMLKQVGVEEAVGVLPREYVDWRRTTIDNPWDYTPLAIYKEMVEEEGLRLTAIEDNPPMDKIRYGAPGAEEELDNVCTLIDNMGKLGISIWCAWVFTINAKGTPHRLTKSKASVIMSSYPIIAVSTSTAKRSPAIT